MTEPAATAPAPTPPASPRARWLARGLFLFFLLKGLAWLAVPALIAAGLWNAG